MNLIFLLDQFNLICVPVFCVDPSTWPSPIPSDLLCKLAKTEFKEPITISSDVSKFLKLYLNDQRKNGESFIRNWIRVSYGSVYCLPCSIYSRASVSPWVNFSGKGFSDFNHSLRGVTKHESSSSHIASVSQWLKYLKAERTNSSVQSLVARQIQKNTNEWKQILKGVLDCVLYLATNNLAFRGQTDNIQSENCGNFLGLVKLLGKYYPPLTKHLQNLSPGKTSYLSSKIQNEFIDLCGSRVLDHILKQIRERKYYAIMVDSTPDVSKRDQLSFVIRTVECTSTECKIHENFLSFIETQEKTGKGLSEVILKTLGDYKLNILDCKAQGYDNGANMAGKYSGVQARILEESPEAHFVPCAAHSLNLVGSNAAEKILQGKLLLGTVQNLYSFFASSTSKWNMLMDKCNITLKLQSNTRWSSKSNAVSALWEQFSSIVTVLESFAAPFDTDDEEPEAPHSFPADVVADANSRLASIANFKFLLGLCVWNDILRQINRCNEYLQLQNCDISRAEKKLGSLCEWLDEYQESGWEKAVNLCTSVAEANEISVESGFEKQRRGRGLNPKYNDASKVAAAKKLSCMERFKLEFFDEVLNKLKLEMNNRFQQIRKAALDFGFLWGESLDSLSWEDKEKCVKDLCASYPRDLDPAAFVSEVQTLKHDIMSFCDDNSRVLRDIGPMDVLNILHRNGLSANYWNCNVALRIFLTSPVSVASNERSFSKLKLIKGYLRSRMSQERLNGLAMLSIERDVAKEIDTDEVINEFASRQGRRVAII